MQSHVRSVYSDTLIVLLISKKCSCANQLVRRLPKYHVPLSVIRAIHPDSDGTVEALSWHYLTMAGRHSGGTVAAPYSHITFDHITYVRVKALKQSLTCTQSALLDTDIRCRDEVHSIGFQGHQHSDILIFSKFTYCGEIVLHFTVADRCWRHSANFQSCYSKSIRQSLV